MQASLPSKILVVRLGAIGDVTNALAFATALAEARPGVFIGWAVHELALPLVRDHPHVQRVHLWRRRGGLREFLRVVREVRGEAYDLAVDLQRLTKSALLARLSGAPRVLGYDRPRSKELSWLLCRERIAPGPASAPMLEHYLEFARHLGVADPPARRVLPREAAAEAWAEERIAELGAAPILLNLGSSKPANRWPAERFGHLARALIDGGGHPVCLTGGPDDRQAAHAALDAAGAPAPRDLVGATSLLQLVALMRRARLFVGCDTGPMHLAAAVDLPVVAIFGAGDERRTGPYGAQHRVVRLDLDCTPCERRRCPLPRHDCMLDLGVERVLEAIGAQLSDPAASGKAVPEAGA